MKTKTIFELKNISVAFNKHSLIQRTLKEVLGAKLKGTQSQKINALNDVNLQIIKGEHVGILGRNGAGNQPC